MTSFREEKANATGLHPNDLTDEFREGSSATYCPEDNKLRLYLSDRVERQSYAYLSKIGYKSTPKQDCDFVATWSIKAEDAALALIADCDDIGDEDTSPQERSVQRAERFAGYRDKRRSEAHGHADSYEAGPSAFGHQNERKAQRAADRHERHKGRALTQWDKAEYWQHRTQGVIDSARYKSSPSVRRGRILEIEKHIRKIEACYTPKDNAPREMMKAYNWADHTQASEETEHVYLANGSRGGRWVEVSKLDAIRDAYARSIAHLKMRLAYEMQMIGDDGGLASEVEYKVGGWIGKHQIHKVNKSPATGRVVSLGLWGEHGWKTGDDGKPLKCIVTVNIERMGEDINYRDPTPEDLAALKAKKPKTVKLINPTTEDAKRLQDHWNKPFADKGRNPTACDEITQGKYSRWSKTDMANTVLVDAEGWQTRDKSKAVFKVRALWRVANADCILVLSDKPQKPLPLDWAAIEAPQAEAVAAE
jgi:hypothetical protein